MPTENVRLVRPSLEWQESYLSFYHEWIASGEEMVPWVISKDPQNFPEMVEWLREHESGQSLPEGWVPSSTFWLVTESRQVVGVVNIRHALTAHLRNAGGHIGYGIRPSERRKGYATKILALSLEEASKLGIDRVLVVCDATNRGSELTIRKNGGVQDTSYVDKDGAEILRFWIQIHYYEDNLNLTDVEALEHRLRGLVEREISSVDALKDWLEDERRLLAQMNEAMTGHAIDFFRDTTSEGRHDAYRHDQTTVRGLLESYQAKLDRKFVECSYADELDDKQYGLLRRFRRTKCELFREENIAKTVREQELYARYNQVMGGLTIEWNGEERSYSYVKSLMDAPERSTRERAWRAVAQGLKQIKPELDDIMTQLVRLRHEMALAAGFENYRDYIFALKNREYSVQDCYDYHHAAEKCLIPAWERLVASFQDALGVDSYRPWDMGPCTLQNAPYQTTEELIAGVEDMLSRTDRDFHYCFRNMLENGLVDLGERRGKRSGGFCDALPATKNCFVFMNFGPSFNGVIALIHEIGHAYNFYEQWANGQGPEEFNLREEVCELYSHGLELLTFDKLDAFYRNELDLKNAKREELHRTFRMLMNPLVGDMFQHWMYTNPDHTPLERDAKFLEINKRLTYHPVDTTDLEEEVSESWMNKVHFFMYPFYQIEYALSQLGAVQLLQLYQTDKAAAVAAYKRGAGADWNQSIAEIYRDTGVAFDFSEATVAKVGKFLESLIQGLE